MMNMDLWLRRRTLIGAALGAVLAPLAVFLLSSLLLPEEGEAVGSLWVGMAYFVTPAMEEAFGSPWLAAAVQSLLAALFGGVVAVATLPFADDGRELICRSLGHFALTAGSFSLLLWVCRWVSEPGYILLWVGLLALLYVIIWLGRWIGWYMEVIQLRTLLGLDPGPSPLKWRETAPYFPFALLVCDGVPVVLRGVEKLLGGDVPALSGVLLPFLLLPVVGFMSGVSLGKRQGVCVLYPLICFVCYLPVVFLLFNSSAMFHCFMIAVPAAAGNVLGWLYRRAVPKKR